MQRERHTTATNDRKVVHKYIPIDENHNVAVQVGRCKKCGKITECSCDNCGEWNCANHLDDKKEYCNKCKTRTKQSYFG